MAQYTTLRTEYIVIIIIVLNGVLIHADVSAAGDKLAESLFPALVLSHEDLQLLISSLRVLLHSVHTCTGVVNFVHSY